MADRNGADFEAASRQSTPVSFVSAATRLQDALSDPEGIEADPSHHASQPVGSDIHVLPLGTGARARQIPAGNVATSITNVASVPEVTGQRYSPHHQPSSAPVAPNDSDKNTLHDDIILQWAREDIEWLLNQLTGYDGSSDQMDLNGWAEILDRQIHEVEVVVDHLKRAEHRAATEEGRRVRDWAAFNQETMG